MTTFEKIILNDIDIHARGMKLGDTITINGELYTLDNALRTMSNPPFRITLEFRRAN